MYIYSNILGTFVFNQNFQVREKVMFSKEDTLKYFEDLFENKAIKPELDFEKKFKNIVNLRLNPDDRMDRVFKALEGTKGELYSRNLFLTKWQIKKSVQADLLITQASDSISEINKAINLLSKRLREWYSYSLPEIENTIDDHKTLCEQIVQKSRKDLMSKNKIDLTMGAELSDPDESAIISLASSILDLFKQKDSKEKYLEKLMKKACPNITAVAGYLIGGKILSYAGSLKSLVLMPASTVQLLGAEKALFRHMVNNKSRPPKHGIIIEHQLLQKAKKDDRGKVARSLADKILLAAKVDYFKGEFIGDRLKKELEEKFK